MDLWPPCIKAQEKQAPGPIRPHQSPTPGHLCGRFPTFLPQWQGRGSHLVSLFGAVLRHREARIIAGACRFNYWPESLPPLDTHPLGGQCSPAFCPWAWSRELPWTTGQADWKCACVIGRAIWCSCHYRDIHMPGSPAGPKRMSDMWSWPDPTLQPGAACNFHQLKPRSVWLHATEFCGVALCGPNSPVLDPWSPY